MITMIRYRKEIVDVLFSKSLCTCHPENEAAKLFIKWLKEHPEYSVSDVSLRIEAVEEEEDHYGNGGGVYRTMHIVKCRQETDAEYEARTSAEEDAVFDEFADDVEHAVTKLIRELDIYPNLTSQAITDKTKEILGRALWAARSCLKDKMQEARSKR